MNSKTKNRVKQILPLFICTIFLIAYLLLTLVKHNNFLTGYDQAVYEQAIWKYSEFRNPISTVHAFYNTPVYFDHFEPILVLLSPVYWISNYTGTLLIIQVIGIIVAAYIIFKLALFKKVSYLVAISILIVFLTFYGIQNAIWSDFHSLTLSIPFLALFIYFLEKEKYKQAIIPFLLAIICKEDIALFTFLIAGVLYFIHRRKNLIYFALSSIVYLIFVFGIYFPYLTPGYRFQNDEGLLSNINVTNFYNTQDKRDAILYSLASFGFIPLLAPLYLVIYVADLAHYFVLGSDYVSSAQGIFLHYRGPLALFLAWPTIIAISKFKQLNKWPVALYLILCAFAIQYILHLPLSYLSKPWFWQAPSGISDIKAAIVQVHKDAPIATQVNITTQLAHRDQVYILWPEQKEFEENSPCNDRFCRWFKTGESVRYVLVDTSSSWDARHFLENREDFIEAVSNLEKEKIIKPIFKQNNTTLYKVIGKI